MKKWNLKLAVTLMVCCAFVFSSCIGSFALHRKVLNWNEGIGDRWANEVVFLALNIVPVYSIVYLADILVINSVEFWSGENPVASIGDVRKVKGENGNYLVTRLENGYSIVKENEENAMNLTFNQDNNSWNVSYDGVTNELFRINENGSIEFSLPNGEALNVMPDEEGLNTLRTAVAGCYMAAR